MARIKALLRRVQVVDDKPSDALPKQIIFGDWTLDALAHRDLAQWKLRRDGFVGPWLSIDVVLTRPNEVLITVTPSLSRPEGREALPFERGIDVQLSRLRSRLGDGGKYPHYIKTMRGNGYILAVPVQYEHW